MMIKDTCFLDHFRFFIESKIGPVEVDSEALNRLEPVRKAWEEFHTAVDKISGIISSFPVDEQQSQRITKIFWVIFHSSPIICEAMPRGRVHTTSYYNPEDKTIHWASNPDPLQKDLPGIFTDANRIYELRYQLCLMHLHEKYSDRFPVGAVWFDKRSNEPHKRMQARSILSTEVVFFKALAHVLTGATPRFSKLSSLSPLKPYIEPDIWPGAEFNMINQYRLNGQLFTRIYKPMLSSELSLRNEIHAQRALLVLLAEGIIKPGAMLEGGFTFHSIDFRFDKLLAVIGRLPGNLREFAEVYDQLYNEPPGYAKAWYTRYFEGERPDHPPYRHIQYVPSQGYCRYRYAQPDDPQTQFLNIPIHPPRPGHSFWEKIKA